MVYHRNQAQYARAGWRLAVFIPSWAVQEALIFGLVGFFSYHVSSTVTAFRHSEEQKFPKLELAWESANIAFGLLWLCLSVAEVIRLVSETLTPTFLLTTHIVKLVCSLAVLTLDIIMYTQDGQEQHELIAIAIVSVLIASAIPVTMYAGLTYRRLLKYDDYHLPMNARPYGFAPDQEPASSPNKLKAEDKSRNRSVSISSFSSLPSLSLRPLSLRFSPSPSPSPEPQQQQQQQPETAGAEGAAHPASYDHRRDTLFDEYRAQRSQGRARGGRVASADVERDAGRTADRRASGPLLGVDAVARGGAETRRSRAASWGAGRMLLSLEEVDLGEGGAEPGREEALRRLG